MIVVVVVRTSSNLAALLEGRKFDSQGGDLIFQLI
jgi:hypothetical protein